MKKNRQKIKNKKLFLKWREKPVRFIMVPKKKLDQCSLCSRQTVFFYEDETKHGWCACKRHLKIITKCVVYHERCVEKTRIKQTLTGKEIEFYRASIQAMQKAVIVHQYLTYHSDQVMVGVEWFDGDVLKGRLVSIVNVLTHNPICLDLYMQRKTRDIWRRRLDSCVECAKKCKEDRCRFKLFLARHLPTAIVNVIFQWVGGFVFLY